MSNKFAITELATWYGLNGLTRNNVQRTTMGLNGETDPAWSMLHLWSGLINIDTRRDWMNLGTSYIANGDVMYTGLLERPWADGDAQQTDAVIAWGCQIDEGFEDNFRIIFLEADADTTDQGTEMMRITPWGNIGMGNSFSNALQPHRRTVVHERRDSAQFRIAWGVDPNPVLGQHADFQVTGNGNLHIKPRNDNANRTVAIGFLSGELGNPVNNAARLDVGGRVRVRNLQDTLPDCLVTGFNASQNAADHYLTRLDFIGATDSVLSGAGTWVPLSDCRWEDVNSGTVPGNTDLRTGFSTSSDCYRDKVVIGANGAKRAKLEAYSRSDRDKVFDAIYARAAGVGDTVGTILTGITGETEGFAGALTSVYVGMFGNAGYIGEPGIGQSSHRIVQREVHLG